MKDEQLDPYDGGPDEDEPLAPLGLWKTMAVLLGIAALALIIWACVRSGA